MTGQICFQVNFDLTNVDSQPTVQPKIMHTQEVVQEVVARPQEHASKSAIFLWLICKNFETQEV